MKFTTELSAMRQRGLYLGVLCLFWAGLSATQLAQAQNAVDSLADRHERARVTELWAPVPDTVAVNAAGLPSDAVVLLVGDDLSAWRSVNGGPIAWQVKDGILTVEGGTGDIETLQVFQDVQLHIEWRAPAEVVGDGQGRGNSGVFLSRQYEIQVLDSYQNPTYSNGQAASVYKQHIPLVNASRAPGEWQSYDIIFQAPRFSTSGRLGSPARATVLHNGVLVQNNVVLHGPTEYVGKPNYVAHGPAPIKLQDHGNPVSYRNIWVRPL